MSDLPVTNPFPLPKLMKVDLSNYPACQVRRQPTAHNLHSLSPSQTHKPTICPCDSLIHSNYFAAAYTAHTYRGRHVAPHSHDARWWLGEQDQHCQLHWELLTKHRAFSRMQTLSSNTGWLRPLVDLAQATKRQNRQVTKHDILTAVVSCKAVWSHRRWNNSWKTTTREKNSHILSALSMEQPSVCPFMRITWNI